MTHINQDDLTKALLDLADENPDFVYPTEWNAVWEDEYTGETEYAEDCEYLHPDSTPENPKGACIMGQALIRIGHADILPERGDVRDIYTVLRNTNLSNTYLGVLLKVQSRQDEYKPWGVAVEPLREFTNSNSKENE